VNAKPRDRAGPNRRGVLERFPAPVLFLASGCTQYYGAALAVGLFAVLPAASVAWWRLAVSASILIAWRRPWRQPWTARELGASAVFGIVLASMNVAFYLAIAHLPLGTAVAIEFLGPVAVAAATGHGWRDRVSIALALAGVVLLAGVQLEGGLTADVVMGLVAIFASAAAWAGYIVLGRRIAVRRDGISSLAVGMSAGALLYSPLAIGAVGPVVTDPSLALSILGIAVLSSVIPYVIEQIVLRRVSAARFAILLSLLPVTAAVVGAVFLAQRPSVLEVLGMALVCVAIVLSADRSGAIDGPEAPPLPTPPLP